LKKVWQRFVIGYTGVIKMVRLIPSTVFMKDPVDVWGKETNVSLAELAVRTHAPPMTFSRSGNIIAWVDFESGTPNYTVSKTGAPTCGRSTAYARNGDFSYIIDGDDSNHLTLGLQTNDFHIGKLGSSVMFSSSGTKYYITTSLYYYDGTDFHAAELKYDRTAEKLYYLNSAAAYVEIADEECLNYQTNFSTFKVVADFSNGKYVRALCFGSEYDLSAYPLYVSNSAVVKHLETRVKVQGITAGGMRVYIDNMTITENES